MGRAKLTIRTCSCGKKKLRCNAKNGKGLRCGNRVRVTGFCARHDAGKLKRHLRCAAKNGSRTLCKNRPRLCGRCAVHCGGRK